jgi:hypothetical protein
MTRRVSLTDNTRVVIYDRNVFIIKGTGVKLVKDATK